MKQVFRVPVCDFFLIFLTDWNRLQKAPRARHGQIWIVDGIQDSIRSQNRVYELEVRQVQHAAGGAVARALETSIGLLSDGQLA